MALLISLGNNLKSFGILWSVPIQRFSILQPLVKQMKNRNVLRYVSQTRTFHSLFRRPTKKQWRIQDEIPDGYELIYRNTTDRTILVAQAFATASTVIIALIAIYKSDKQNKYELPFTDENPLKIKPRETDNEMFVYAAFFIITLVVFQYFVQQMPQRIYYHTQFQKYWLVFRGNIPFTIKKMPLKVGEVRPAPGGVTPWKEHRYELKDGSKIILMDSYFGRPADLYIMMGVQRDPKFEPDYKK